ncbi:hypothetical protein WMF18_38565 [Sorangium sp. So ce315]
MPEGLSSSAGMKRAGRSVKYIVGVWGGIAAASGVAALLGFAVFRGFSPAVIAATTAVAAGAILAMLADTMIPEAFEEAHDLAGLIMVAGFLASFWLSKHSEGNAGLNPAAEPAPSAARGPVTSRSLALRLP